MRRPVPKNRRSATFSWGAPPPYTSPTRTAFSSTPVPRLDTPDFSGSPFLETAQMVHIRPISGQQQRLTRSITNLPSHSAAGRSNTSLAPWQAHDQQPERTASPFLHAPDPTRTRQGSGASNAESLHHRSTLTRPFSSFQPLASPALTDVSGLSFDPTLWASTTYARDSIISPVDDQDETEQAKPHQMLPASLCSPTYLAQAKRQLPGTSVSPVSSPMDKVKGVAKNGWHPKGESWRGDNKGINQVAGWVGKGKNSSNDRAQEHVSRPLATLKDPELFGPPPKNVNYHGGTAVPNATTPDRRGLGAPMSSWEIREKEEAERREAQAAGEAARKPPPPSLPYRVDTSGLSTAGLPKPPVRRFDPDEQSPSSPARPNIKPKPSLPPRLPRRQGSTPVENSPSPPPPYSETQGGRINQGAASRLASAGMNVPGFGIGSSRNEDGFEGNTTSPSHYTGSNNAQVSELQSRFSNFSTRSQDPTPPSQGTSLAEKKAALSTAQSFRNDPSSVSLSDARTTAATANNFRERHGDQVAAGWKSANAVNKKYDVANRLNSYSSHNGGSSQAQEQQSPSSPVASPSTTIPLHKRPPPPPPQKPSFSGGSAASPPPVPLSSKPRT
ncbi:MAG: hypothetical protein Q9218_007574 [Villophora microphyllina]